MSPDPVSIQLTMIVGLCQARPGEFTPRPLASSILPRAQSKLDSAKTDARIARLSAPSVLPGSDPCGAVAQLGERRVRNAKVEGSIPFRSTNFPGQNINLRAHFGHQGSEAP